MGLTRRVISERIAIKVNELDELLQKILGTSSQKIDLEKLEFFPSAYKASFVVAGGCIASMLLGEKVNDFDIYFNDTEIAKSVRKITTDNLKSGKHEGEITILSITPNSVTLSNQMQLITRFAGSPEEIISNFDFIHCTNYWTAQEGLVLNQPALESLLAKDLRYVGSKFPVCSMIRTKKFIRRGWKVSAGQYLKIALQLNKLNFTDREILKEQLTGVDVSYFCQVMNWIETHPAEAEIPEHLDKMIDALDMGEEADFQ